jgi:uncharacterized membrane protein
LVAVESIEKRGLARFLLAAVVATLALGTVFATSASAAPAWKFEGAALEGKETIVGAASGGTFNIPGLTTKCKITSYAMTIWNEAGTGRGEITALGFENCTTNTKACSVESMKAKKLNWPLHLSAINLGSYLILEGVRISTFYSGEECALAELEVLITGTAGAFFDNPSSTFTFSPTNFKTTGTQLSTFGSQVEWNATFTTEATGAHKGQALKA